MNLPKKKHDKFWKSLKENKIQRKEHLDSIAESLADLTQQDQ